MSRSNSPNPEMSVVVTVVEGGSALVRCLDAIAAQEGGVEIEVLIPFDETIAEVGLLGARYPTFTFLPMGALVPSTAHLDAFLEHELFDRRRAAGLHAARGRLIGMLEDRGAPRADWARAMVEEHARHDAAAIGGAVVNVAQGALNRALFVCDYGRHAPPYAEGEAEYLTDINICYRKDALEAVQDVWRERYQETAVNWTLRDRGWRLWLSARPVVLHKRGDQPLGRTLSQRLQWGRVFGLQRGARWSRSRALVSAGAALVLPLLLLVRHTRLLAAKGARLGEILPTMAALMTVIPAWALGEALGYVQARSRRT